MSETAVETAVTEATPPPAIPSTVALSEKDFAELCEQRARCERLEAEHDRAADEAKSAKKAWEAARETFERMFDRMVARQKGDDLPLFNSQTDAIAAAEADPVVTKLADRLIARGHDVNLLIVAGYTEAERNEAAAYLDLLDERDRLLADGADAGELETPIPPPFLQPQPLTAIELADLAQRAQDQVWDLADAITPELIGKLSAADVATLRAHLDQVESIKAEKGDAITVDDLPEPSAELQAAIGAAAASVKAEQPELPAESTPKKRSKKRTNGSGKEA